MLEDRRRFNEGAACRASYSSEVSYGRSAPLQRWLGERRQTIDVLATGHASVGALSGPGRPLDVSKPLAHAYVIVMLREFQSFVRDLHDLAAERLVTASAANPPYIPLLVEGLTKGRAIDRGNATQDVVKSDFGRLGLTTIDIKAQNVRWTKPQGTDSNTFNALVQLRNALGHGNETQLERMIRSGEVRDTVTWARQQLPVLNRYARAIDRIVWDYIRKTTGSEPWT